jgi:hypothetical protein
MTDEIQNLGKRVRELKFLLVFLDSEQEDVKTLNTEIAELEDEIKRLKVIAAAEAGGFNHTVNLLSTPLNLTEFSDDEEDPIPPEDPYKKNACCTIC